MTMNIKTIVIHEIKKNERETSANIYLTDEPLDPSDTQIEKLVSGLDDSFQAKTVRRARFADGGAFRTTISDFTNIDLVASSQKLTERLKTGIESIPAAKGGYLVFCEYKTTRDFLSVFLVRNTDGSLLKDDQSKGKASWIIEVIQYIDVKNFAMGIKINLDILNGPNNDEHRYVQFVPGSTDISDYFMNWVGVDKGTDTDEKKDGDALLKIINEIDMPDEIHHRDEFKKMVYDYTKSNAQLRKPINLKHLSAHLFSGNEHMIKEYCEEKGIDIDEEFQLKGRQLDKFFKVSVQADGIKLAAARENFRDNKIRVLDDRKMVLINSEQFYQALKAELGTNS